MIYERWDKLFDIEKLQAHLRDHVLPLEPVRQSPSFGGWSVLSANGSYRDGWQQGHKVLTAETTLEQARENLSGVGLKRPHEYKVPTEICHGYLLDLISELEQAGLYPRRARIIRLTPGMGSSWHRDCPDHHDAVRLHIPIITNEGCFFETETGRAHLPADGNAYFLRVNRMHRVMNNGTEYRYHFVADIRDTRHVSQFHHAVGTYVQ